MVASPEVEQLMDLFEDRSEAELQMILSRHGGDLDSAVAAICNGERAVGALPESGDNPALSRKQRYDSEQPEYVPWSAAGSHEENVLNRSNARSEKTMMHQSYQKKKEPGVAKGSVAVGQFGALSSSRSKRRSSRRPGTEEETDTGSMPISMSSSVSSSNLGRSGTTNGAVGGSRDSREAPNVGAFAVAGAGAGVGAVAAAGVAGGAAGNQGDPIVAEAVTRDHLAESIREELRSELRQEIQNLGAPLASAEVVVPQRDDEATGTSQLTGDTEPKQPWYKSKCLWIVATIVLVAAVGGLVGAIVGMSGGGGSSETDKLDEGAGGTGTAPPTDPPSPAPTPAPVDATFPTVAPVVGPTPFPSFFPSFAPVDGPTRLPTPRPSRNPTRNPTRHPTHRPTQRPTEFRRTPCTDEYGRDIEVCREDNRECTFFVRLGGQSCQDYCFNRGGFCFRAQADRNGGCEADGSNDCRENFNDNICTCSIGGFVPTPNVPQPPPPTRNPTRNPTKSPTNENNNDEDCKDRYGSGIDVCEESSSDCTFFVELGGQSCSNYCNGRGGSCISARNNENGETCKGTDSHSCGADRSDTICKCTL